ncbi:MAG: hypothetical protein ACFB10_08745 [Salibacteraceae bacterium]
MIVSFKGTPQPNSKWWQLDLATVQMVKWLGLGISVWLFFGILSEGTPEPAPFYPTAIYSSPTHYQIYNFYFPVFCLLSTQLLWLSPLVGSPLLRLGLAFLWMFTPMYESVALAVESDGSYWSLPTWTASNASHVLSKLLVFAFLVGVAYLAQQRKRPKPHPSSADTRANNVE